jgi:hypothetical protein
MTAFHMLNHALSVQRFLNHIVDDLVAYRTSTIVLLPSGVDPADVWELIRSELDRRKCDLREIPLADLDQHPVLALESFFGTTRSAQALSRSLEAFFERAHIDGLLPDILYLEQLQHLPGTAIAEWLTLTTRWAKLNQGLTQSDRNRTAICLVVPATLVLDKLPEGNVHLAIHWWWGFPSVSETLMLCRYDTSFGDDHCLTSWREHLLASLAAGDSTFLEHLWSSIDQCDQVLERKALDFAVSREWTATMLRSCGADILFKGSLSQRGHVSAAPPAVLRQLWAIGALQWTPEYGVEMHTAAVACLGLRDEFRHRIWRGQVHLIYPTVDYLRLIVCNWLTEHYGRDWPVHWRRPEDERLAEAVERDPNACELSYLVSLLDRNVHREVKMQWYSLVDQLTRIRNKLAHYCPVSFAEFEQLWKLADEALQPRERLVLAMRGP